MSVTVEQKKHEQEPNDDSTVATRSTASSWTADQQRRLLAHSGSQKHAQLLLLPSEQKVRSFSAVPATQSRLRPLPSLPEKGESTAVIVGTAATTSGVLRRKQGTTVLSRHSTKSGSSSGKSLTRRTKQKSSSSLLSSSSSSQSKSKSKSSLSHHPKQNQGLFSIHGIAESFDARSLFATPLQSPNPGTAPAAVAATTVATTNTIMDRNHPHRGRPGDMTVSSDEAGSSALSLSGVHSSVSTGARPIHSTLTRSTAQNEEPRQRQPFLAQYATSFSTTNSAMVPLAKTMPVRVMQSDSASLFGHVGVHEDLLKDCLEEVDDLESLPLPVHEKERRMAEFLRKRSRTSLPVLCKPRTTLTNGGGGGDDDGLGEERQQQSLAFSAGEAQYLSRLYDMRTWNMYQRIRKTRQSTGYRPQTKSPATNTRPGQSAVQTAADPDLFMEMTKEEGTSDDDSDTEEMAFDMDF